MKKLCIILIAILMFSWSYGQENIKNSEWTIAPSIEVQKVNGNFAELGFGGNLDIGYLWNNGISLSARSSYAIYQSFYDFTYGITELGLSAKYHFEVGKKNHHFIFLGLAGTYDYRGEISSNQTVYSPERNVLAPVRSGFAATSEIGFIGASPWTDDNSFFFSLSYKMPVQYMDEAGMNFRIGVLFGF